MNSEKPNRTLSLNPYPTKRKLKIILASTFVAMALLLWFFDSLHPLPPRSLTMATGPAGSAFETFGKRYKILLAKQGITLNLVPTQGALDNLQKLKDPKSGIQVGFVMGGLADETDSTELVSLGTIAYEPIWLFSHRITTDRGLFSLEKKRVSVGPEGSAARAMVQQLLKKNAMEDEPFQMLGLEPEETEDALLKGKIDAAILVSSMASPVVRQLAKNPKIDLANFRRADAYVARFPSLSKVQIPEGAFDLLKDLPRRDTTLLSTKASLIVRGNLHPALQYL